MPFNPTPSDVHVNQPLTSMSVAYLQAQTAFIADKVFPIVPVEKQSDRYFTYDKGDWFRDEAEERAPGTESAGGGYDVDSTGSYYCRVYAYHKDVDDQVYANQDQPLDMDRDAALFVTQKLLLKRERIWASNYFVNGVWANNKQGNASAGDFIFWSDYDHSDPLNNVDSFKQTVAATTGYMPNTMVVSPDVFATLKNHPKITDRIKYTQRGLLTEDIMGSLFGVEKFLVPMAVYNSAAKGLAASVSQIFSNSVLLVYAQPRPSIMAPSGGYTFAWTGYLGSGGQGNRISKFRMDELRANRVEGELAFDPKLIASDMGVFMYNVLS